MFLCPDPALKQLRGRLAIRAAVTGGCSVWNAVAGPELQIRGGGGLSFSALRASVWSKNKGDGGGASPPRPLTRICHGQLFKVRYDIALNWGGGICDSTYSVMVKVNFCPINVSRVEPPLTRRPPLFKGHSFCQTVHSATLLSILRDDTHTKGKQLRIRLVFIAVFVKSSFYCNQAESEMHLYSSLLNSYLHFELRILPSWTVNR